MNSQTPESEKEEDCAHQDRSTPMEQCKRVKQNVAGLEKHFPLRDASVILLIGQRAGSGGLLMVRSRGTAGS